MKHDTPSRTAAWVAFARSLGRTLPPEARLVDDPWGAAFEQGRRSRLQHWLGKAGIHVERWSGVVAWTLYMQVRTRVIDDDLRAFVARGGRQIVLLGAGYDCRALRLPELTGATVIEVDHPATQGHKRAVLARLDAISPSRYLTWNFEERPVAQLPDALAELGHDRTAPTFTIWEGVTMYLTPDAIDASLRAIRAWSAPTSQLAMTYFAKTRIQRPSLATRAVQMIVARVGEPWIFGWGPDELAPYLAARGFELVRDTDTSQAARELLPAAFASLVRSRDQRFALAEAT